MSLIIWEEPLPKKYREHNLSGNVVMTVNDF
jgi:mRNA-degrading endonuclease YafQ of YafQ-DinJ toxin-antitoxin module